MEEDFSDISQKTFEDNSDNEGQETKKSTTLSKQIEEGDSQMDVDPQSPLGDINPESQDPPPDDDDQERDGTPLMDDTDNTDLPVQNPDNENPDDNIEEQEHAIESEHHDEDEKIEPEENIEHHEGEKSAIESEENLDQKNEEEEGEESIQKGHEEESEGNASKEHQQEEEDEGNEHNKDEGNKHNKDESNIGEDLDKFPDQILAEGGKDGGDVEDDTDAFEEIDVNTAEKNKSSNIEETDAFGGEDRTQIISEVSQHEKDNEMETEEYQTDKAAIDTTTDDVEMDTTENEFNKIADDSEIEKTIDESERDKTVDESTEQNKENDERDQTLDETERDQTVDEADQDKTVDESPDKNIDESTEQDKHVDEVTVDEDRDKDDEAESPESNRDATEDHHDEDDDDHHDDSPEAEEGHVIEAAPNESEDICLLPDEEKELTGAEKEQAIQARQLAEKEAEKEAETTEEPRESVQVDEINVDDDHEAEQEPEHTETTNQEGEVIEIREFEIKELSGDLTEQECYNCKEKKPGKYKLLHDNDFRYLCDLDCVNIFRITHENNEYNLICRRVIISVIIENIQNCVKCKQEKNCHYRYKDVITGDYSYLCEDICLNQFIGKNTEKYLVRRKKYLVEELSKDVEERCVHCKETKKCKYSFKQDEDTLYVCEDACYYLLSKEDPDRFRLKRRSVRVRDLAVIQQQHTPVDNEPKIVARTEAEAEAAKIDRDASFIRRCCQCYTPVNENDERMLQWETLDFCNEVCLGKYQNAIGSRCQSCCGSVPIPSLGKYCVRFGFEIRQFCRASCLDAFKKGLKVCSLCQKDISKNKEGFLAPIGDKGQFKDFCSQDCLKRYDELSSQKKKQTISQCAVCNLEKVVRVEVIIDDRSVNFCSNPCFSAFKFVNNIVPDQCNMCSKFFERKSMNSFTVYQDNTSKIFCCKICMNLFVNINRKIVPCQWCKVKKYNFDMIQKQTLMLCSLNCLTLYGVSLNAVTMRQQKCDQCGRQATPQYHLTMSDTTIRNFCTYQCVMHFQSQFGRTPLTLDSVAEKEADTSSPFPTSLPKRIKQNVTAGTVQLPQKTKSIDQQQYLPIISSVESFAPHLMDIDTPSPSSTKKSRSQRRTRGKNDALSLDYNPQYDTSPVPTPPLVPPKKLVSSHTQTKPPGKRTVGTITLEKAVECSTQIITVPPFPKETANKTTLCKPNTVTKAISCRPNTASVQCQTGKDLYQKILVPIPVPVYVPQPMYMYSAPFPVPVPIPLPIPIPIFIPTTRNSANGIMKEIKKIQDKMPSNPLEADLLMMAEMVAGEKKKEDSDSDDDVNNDDDFDTEPVEPSNSFGEDMLQMALKMAAAEYEESAVDLESAMATNTITPQIHPHIQEEDMNSHQMMMMDGHRQSGRGRKRMLPMDGNVTPRNNRSPQKRQRRDIQQQQQQTMMHHQQIEPIKEEQPMEKPDANMCLKYTFGVNAWKQWVMTKNAELEKSSVRRKPFKSELLQMTADELNYSLCLFVKEVRKPNGSEYAPDTIYYLVLGIQQYLYENGRIDNIFTDPYYERFTDCLDEVARKFSVLYNDSQYIVTRVEEEHLWECKQLGAHSPHVLLSTLMFFNTKHFNLTTVEEHMQLSFSHIMKHWKRSTPGSKAPGSRNVLLRFYPPQTGQDVNPRKKKVYEQQENEENPLRCPVKLYEFYLSKCPESVKTRNDVFYLQPERSCVPDSPVWYSTQPLSRESLSKMLHRVKMVKEINIALLTS